MQQTQTWASAGWRDYELLDCSDGERLERWGDIILARPDPQVIWKGLRRHPRWNNPDAHYRREGGGGAWSKNNLPQSWRVRYGDLAFSVRLMGFKHTGLFPEQAANWDWMRSLLKGAEPGRRVLNLFAYTGGATLAAAGAGACVCHVDAAKGMVAQAKENAANSGLSEAPVRYIVDDCKKFIERELRRGNRYDGIIMDPPSYGRGPTGEVWKLEDSADELITLAAGLLSRKPLFFLVNIYTTGLSPLAVAYILGSRLGRPAHIECGELALPVTQSGLYLPCGSSIRASFS